MTEETLFAAALEKGTPTERAAFLDEACAGDAALRRRVEALLKSHEEADFLRTPAAERAAIAFAGAATDGMMDPADRADPDPLPDFLAPSDEPGSLGRLGRYEVLEVIGRGGMGVVLRAFDATLHRVVAIKVMAAQLATSAIARRRFGREARAAAAVSHDHIVAFHAVEESGGLPYLVMQYVPGMSLQERLDRDGPLQLHAILRIGMQVASGLAAAHAQGLIHRDIKPSNILLENGVERVKITDFGLARAIDDASLTQTGVLAGTPQYMSPEQARGEAVDHRADLFSLGSVLYAMCAGRAPFRAGGTMAILRRVCEEAPGPIREANPDVPDWLVGIIETLHAKDPADRYQTAAEVTEILGRYLNHVQHPSVVPLPPAAKRTRRGRSRRRWPWMLVAPVLLCAFGALAVSEANGVTRLVATVIRIFTPDGTLVIEANDPAVKVTIEGDGGLVIAGAGPQEVRLRPGSYQVRATRDGKPLRLDRDLITIARNDKQIVRVRLEGGAGATTADAAAATADVERGAFVVLGRNGSAERPFDTLAEAVARTTGGDTIEIRGDGPFVIDPVQFQYALTIRAARGARPVLTSGPKRQLPSRSLLVAPRALRLEGLEFRSSYHDAFRILYAVGPLYVANCRFQNLDRSAFCIESDHSCTIRNCELVAGRGDALAIRCDSDAPSVVANSIVVGHINLDEFDFTRGTTVEFRGNTLVSPRENAFRHTLQPMDRPPDQIRDQINNRSGKRLHVALRENLLAGASGFYLLVQEHEFRPRLDAAGLEEWLPRRVEWSDRRNIYHPVETYIAGCVVSQGDNPAEMIPLPHGRAFADWNRFWGLKDTGSSEGNIRFLGGDLHAQALADATRLAAQDFRLRPDSAGYRAGPDGKDLGADLDLVGPGPAYERWKKTPEYQQWQEETRPLK